MSKPVISVIIGSHNENWYTLNQTVQSIRQTGGPYVEIVVVDDASSTAVKVHDPDVKVLTNKKRLGVGPSRHIGVEAASADVILITDAHALFSPDWLDPVCFMLAHPDNLVLCGKCLALNETLPSLSRVYGDYNGARMVILDETADVRWRILTAKWAIDRVGQDVYPLSAMMGACYAMRKSWFMRLCGLRVLKNFGCDEELLSIRTIRAGGRIVMFKRLCVGHIFRSKISKPQFPITIEECLRNTIAVALTCCPAAEAAQLIDKLGRSKQVVRALSMIGADIKSIERDQDELTSVLTMDWGTYLQTIAQIDS